MAKIKTSAIITDISGKVGGTVFQRSGSGLIMKNKDKNVRRKTFSQITSSACISNVQSFWQSLSSTQKTAWSKYAGYNVLSQRKAKGLALSGYQVFMRYNYYLSFYGHQLVSQPCWNKPLPPITELIFDMGGSSISFDIYPYLGCAYYFYVFFLTRTLKIGVKPMKADFRLIFSSTSGSYRNYLTAHWERVFGACNTANKDIHYRIALFSKSQFVEPVWLTGSEYT